MEIIHELHKEAESIFDKYINVNRYVLNYLHFEIYWNIHIMKRDLIDNGILLFFYSIYDIIASRSSVRSYIGSGIERKDSDYSSLLYFYEKYRRAKDAQMSPFGCPKLYKNFEEDCSGKDIKRILGHELTCKTFEELKIIRKYTIFKYLLNHNIHKRKNISIYDFCESYLPQIDDIYDEILNSVENSPIKYIEHGLNFLSLEANCCFEKYYAAAKTLKQVKENIQPRHSEMKNELRYLSDIVYFQNGTHNFQNYMILGWKDIFQYYNYPQRNAFYVRNLIFVSSNIINAIAANLTAQFSELNADIVFSDEVNSFFENRIGCGQHIIPEKEWDDLTVKFFRDLYNPNSQ